MIDIVIPTYNRHNSLVRLLNSILESFSSFPHKLHNVIVVDDGSTDRTSNLQISSDKILLLRQDNSGPAKARNLGFQHSSCKYVLFIDDDCIVTGDYCSKILEHTSNNTYDLVSFPAHSLTPPNSRLECYLDAIGFLRNACHDSKGISCLPSSNLLVSRQAFRQIGGFSEAFPFPGGEDNNFTLKARAQLCSLFFDDSVTVYHDNNISFLDFVKKYYNYGKGNAVNQILLGLSNEDSLFWARRRSDFFFHPLEFIKWTQIEQSSEFKGDCLDQLIYRILAFVRIFAYEIGGLKLKSLTKGRSATQVL